MLSPWVIKYILATRTRYASTILLPPYKTPTFKLLRYRAKSTDISFFERVHLFSFLLQKSFPKYHFFRIWYLFDTRTETTVKQRCKLQPYFHKAYRTRGLSAEQRLLVFVSSADISPRDEGVLYSVLCLVQTFLSLQTCLMLEKRFHEA